MIRANKTIAILLATYNGCHFIREQLDSIFSQTNECWHLYVHDDGSKDGTLEILSEYENRYSGRMTVLKYDSQGGAKNNFLSLLEKVEAPYYMFSDQDDVWLPNKVEIEYARMKEAESHEGAKPILVFTDLVVVDVNKNVINPSFWEYEGIYPKFVKRFTDLAALNIVTGCTMLFNHKAKEILGKSYGKAMMHDAWIAMHVIACGGALCEVDTATMLYRQHGDNTLGARDASTLTWKYRMRNIVYLLKMNYLHFRQMNDVSSISLIDYISTKIRYRKYIKNVGKG